MNRIPAVAFGIALAAGAFAVVAQESMTPATSPSTQPSTAPSTQAAAPVNTICPVSGEKVDPKVETASYNGKTIGFCCADCVEPFKKDPQKYASKIK